MGKKRTTLSLDSDLVALAKENGLNISQEVETILKQKLYSDNQIGSKNLEKKYSFCHGCETGQHDLSEMTIHCFDVGFWDEQTYPSQDYLCSKCHAKFYPKIIERMNKNPRLRTLFHAYNAKEFIKM